MTPKLTLIATVLTAAIAARSGAQEAPALSHEPAACLETGSWPAIVARASGEVATVRVLFHAADSPFWYAVDLPCSEPALPKAGRGPKQVGLVRGAPRDTASFDFDGVEAFIEGVAEDTPAWQGGPSQGWLLPYRAAIRIRTVAASDVEGRLIAKDIQGELLAVEQECILVRVDGGTTARVRRSDVVKVEYRTEGSDAMGVVGGFAGVAGGFVAALLTCVAFDDLCGSSAPLWIGMAAGGVLGAAGGMRGQWVPVPVLTSGPTSVTVRPVPGGGAVGLTLSF